MFKYRTSNIITLIEIVLYESKLCSKSLVKICIIEINITIKNKQKHQQVLQKKLTK